MSDPRFDRDYRLAGGQDFERYRAEHAGSGGLWTAGLILGIILLLGGLLLFVPENPQVASNRGDPMTGTNQPVTPAPAPPPAAPQQ